MLRRLLRRLSRRSLRSALVGTAAVASVGLPSAARAQTYQFNSCATPGVCGWMEAFFTGTLLTVRLANADNVFGSALFSAQIIFDEALASATPGDAFSTEADETLVGPVTSIGTTSPGGWFFSGVGGSAVLDLAAFSNVYLEGSAPSAFRAAPGDPDSGTWVTTNGYVEFNADLSTVSGAAGGQISGMGFCTDQDCVAGNAIATPEPATLTLVATGLFGIAAARRRRKNGPT